jgi:hypothetical protein
VKGCEDGLEGTAGAPFAPVASVWGISEVEGASSSPATAGTDGGAASDALPGALAATLVALDAALPVSIFFDLGAIAFVCFG